MVNVRILMTRLTSEMERIVNEDEWVRASAGVISTLTDFQTRQGSDGISEGKKTAYGKIDREERFV